MKGDNAMNDLSFSKMRDIRKELAEVYREKHKRNMQMW